MKKILVEHRTFGHVLPIFSLYRVFARLVVNNFSFFFVVLCVLFLLKTPSSHLSMAAKKRAIILVFFLLSGHVFRFQRFFFFLLLEIIEEWLMIYRTLTARFSWRKEGFHVSFFLLGARRGDILKERENLHTKGRTENESILISCRCDWFDNAMANFQLCFWIHVKHQLSRLSSLEQSLNHNFSLFFFGQVEMCKKWSLKLVSTMMPLGSPILNSQLSIVLSKKSFMTITYIPAIQQRWCRWMSCLSCFLSISLTNDKHFCVVCPLLINFVIKLS